MRTKRRRFAPLGTAAVLASSLVACLILGWTQAAIALAQNPQPRAATTRPPATPDPRVLQRTYHFADTNENLPYALYVSSKVSRDKGSPLIVALHGLGGDGNHLLHGNALELAEDGGYIMVGPMGYNRFGWYGSPAISRTDGKRLTLTEPPNLTALSEKDVLNVLDIVSKEFNIDEKRVYLLGHSMGGAGALYLGAKYASRWAAVAALSPAVSTEILSPAILEPVKNTLPLLLMHGDADELVPVANSRSWNQAILGFQMTNYTYLEVRGADHNGVVAQAMPEVFQFFSKHNKPASR